MAVSLILRGDVTPRRPTVLTFARVLRLLDSVNGDVDAALAKNALIVKRRKTLHAQTYGAEVAVVDERKALQATVAARLRAAGIGADAFCELTGRTQSTLHTILYGRHVGLDTLRAVEAALNAATTEAVSA